ncbi:MAG TPA: site-specific DNA-methyltransferase, partial [Acidimicrobiales bacterium]|nr:site-specific DNA-methyltransferase [Acidimicrobiales bacterium]
MTRRSTSTSAFGVSRRENHDATAFYRRFTPPDLSDDEGVAEHRAIDKLIAGDSRHMDEVPDSSVALVVTSPPYFAGKEYEEALGEGGVPATYIEYLDLLRDVFAECVRTLEPGGRIAVNVANLGRRPYRSLSADVIGILQDDLRLLLRGEIIWVKQRGSSGSCAWGSFQKPGNPVLRDLTERVIVASKGRFDRAVVAKKREKAGLPSESSMTREDFMEHTLDVWEIPAESATRVGHPAPFPVELPARLIDMYTYRGDLVLDPFVGSGSAAVAALRAGRHYVGYDLDESYVNLAESRVAAEREKLALPDGATLAASPGARGGTGRVVIPAVARRGTGGSGGTGSGTSGTSGSGGSAGSAGSVGSDGSGRDPWEEAVREGRAAKEIAVALLEAAGFTKILADVRQPGGVEVSFSASDSKGRTILFEVGGSFTTHRPGLKRSDALWKSIGKAAVLAEAGLPFVLLTTDLPPRGSPGAEALRRVTGAGKPVLALVEILSPAALGELAALCGPGDPPAGRR